MQIQDASIVPGNGVELVGKVMPHNHGFTVKVLTCWDLGADVGELRLQERRRTDDANAAVDYGVAAAVVDATHRYKELFYEAT